jgi:hypothetical protein
MIDVVAVDADGVITLCECKRAQSAEARRSVLALAPPARDCRVGPRAHLAQVGLELPHG